ncbi:hypothetical protein OV079_50485 [Nannocystis pusilla]|uniref:Uncharacterized protein n=1 Tax=Nannocystis pusilla TaxID=889268 RepID=A0A9X3F8Z4_9BACT|nr:hypothetical protein [Nannocystis pusilla]MCY1013626.1 hypothetical protein [Nannocystis pusilla]
MNSDSDLFFRQLDVQCVLGGFDFARAKIAWVHPHIRYGADPEEGTDKTFTGMADRMEFKAWLQPGHGFRYRCGYEVEFIAPDDADPDAIYGEDLRLSSPEEVRTDRVLAFNPLELFYTRSVEFVLKQGFPAGEFPVVLVEVKHEDDSGYQVERTYKLTATAQSCRFRVRTPRDVEGVTQYRVLYYPAMGAAIPSQWQVANESAVVLDVPFTQSFLVRVYVAEPPAELAWADVSLRYADDDRPGSYQEGRLFFDQDLKPQVWRVNAADPRQRRYEYCFTLFFNDNTELRAAEWIESDAPTLTLGRRVPMQRTVSVRPAGPSFDDVQLRDITVTLSPVDASGAATELVFEQLDQRKDFTYRAPNAVQVGYVYEVVYRWRNGRTKSVPGASPAGALLLNVPTEVA